MAVKEFSVLLIQILQMVGVALIVRNLLVSIPGQVLSCPLIWVSKLQIEVALSTTESEYIALSQAMRDLIPLMGPLEELTPILSPNKDQPHVL